MATSSTAVVGFVRGLNPAEWDVNVSSTGFIWRIVTTARPVTSATETTIVDTGPFTGSPSSPEIFGMRAVGWNGGGYLTDGKNAIIRIVSGVGAGQYRTISNIATVNINVNTPFDPIPDETSTYTIHPARRKSLEVNATDYGAFFTFRFLNNNMWAHTLKADETNKAYIQFVLKREVFKQWNPDDPTQFTILESDFKWGVGTQLVSKQRQFDTESQGVTSTTGEGGAITLPFVIQFDTTDLAKSAPTFSSLFLTYMTQSGVDPTWLYALDDSENQVLAEYTTEVYVSGRYAPSLWYESSGNVLKKNANDIVYAGFSNNLRGNVVSGTTNTIIVSETFTDGELIGGFLKLISDIGIFDVAGITGNTIDTEAGTVTINVDKTFIKAPDNTAKYEVCFKRTSNISV